MGRHSLYILLAFLTGILAGALAVGGQWSGEEPLESVGRTVSAGVGERPLEAGAGAAPLEAEPSAVALGVVSGEASPLQADTHEIGVGLESRLQAMTESWMGLQGEVTRLQGRVEGLEKRLAAVTAPRPDAVGAAEQVRSDTPESRRAALVKAGIAEDRAADIIWRQAQQELDQLEIRDLAMREGWFGSDRYREEMEQIREDAIDLRAEIGTDSYDRYLFASGEDNRVEIESVIPGSVADEAGLEPGDLVETYGRTRVFRFRDLRTATTEGDRDELVPVRIRRGGDVVDAWLPRGPLGVRLDSTRLDPDT